MSLKITTLIENLPDAEGHLACEHGLSVLVEFDGTRILFDTGQSGAFVKNAEALGVDLGLVDGVVLSHGHYDHTGGVPELLKRLKRKTPVYIGKEFFRPKYKLLEDSSYKYNGNPFSQELLCAAESPAELHFIENDVTWLSERLLLFKNFARVTEYEKINPKFFVKTETGYEQDLFPDEIALGIVLPEGLVLVAGCSHVGIVNILEHIKKTISLPIVAVLGGTHLVEAEEERLKKTMEAFRAHGVAGLAVSHCTGEAGRALLCKEFPTEFVLNNTGNVMKF